MERIRYRINNPVNTGTEEPLERAESLLVKSVPYTDANLEIAKAEAYNGEYEIYDDCHPELEDSSKGDYVTWVELNSAYQAGYDEGYTEGVNSVYD